MTRNEFMDKYGDVVVTFSNYYKYTFNYKAELPDGSLLVVSYGGNSEDIYRHEVGANSPEVVKTLAPYAGSVYRDGKESESFYDY